MKRKITIVLTILSLTIVGCDKAKIELANSIIKNYSIAVKEQDESTMLEIFPDMKYFKEYPKIDRIEITESDVIENNVLALCTLYYETGFGKKIETELKILVNPRDSIIIDVLGYLTRKQRNEIIQKEYFQTFPDLKPKEGDMDVTFVKNETIAWNRTNGYEYYAQKAIAEKTKIKIEINSNKTISYGILEEYKNVKLKLTIINNSDFDCKFKYYDNNPYYKYTFLAFIDKKDVLYGCEGIFNIKQSESINQSYSFKGVYIKPLKKEDIKIKPYFETTEDAIKIVNKYCDENIRNMILSGDKEFWNENYEYRINLD